MFKNIVIAFIGLVIGIIVGIYFGYFKLLPQRKTDNATHHQVIGFLPYWMLNQVSTNYAKDITTLTYFGINIDGNGHIVKLANPQQEEPSWYALNSGEANSSFSNAKKSHIKLSLLISDGDIYAINQLLSNPTANANNLITDVAPLMKKYGFTDLNLDIEYTTTASLQTQENFVQFVKAVKQQLKTRDLGTLTLEISPTDVIVRHLINLQKIEPYADNIVLMAYDYHSTTSFVTGPVAPLNGAGVNLEYDVTTAVEEALTAIPSQKLILGMPLYGYEWETLSNAIQSAIIPASAVLASNNRMQSVLSSCASCSAFFDNETQEEYAYYKDATTGTIHQMSFPTQQSVAAKLAFANKENLGGVALWALGYEGSGMLAPLTSYK